MDRIEILKREKEMEMTKRARVDKKSREGWVEEEDVCSARTGEGLNEIE